MKLAFVLLLVGFMVLSEQQRFPYQYQSRFTPPWSYLEAFSDSDLYSYMLARRFGFFIKPLVKPQSNAFSRNDEPVFVSGLSEPKTEELDLQGRNKGVFEPLPVQREEAQANPRFLFNYVATIGSSSLYNPLQKTIYYFTTSTTTTTFTSTCITSISFAAGSSTVICRKRRDMLGFLAAFDGSLEALEKPSDVSPSDVQQVIPTVSPPKGTQFQLTSSLEEEGFRGENLSAGNEAFSRAKRLFVSTTFVTTYIFSTVTTTRTLSSNFISTSLYCRPSQFTYC